MTRPLTDRERANALEARVAELEAELAGYRDFEDDDADLVAMDDIIKRVRGVPGPARQHPRGAAKLLIYMTARPGRLCSHDALYHLLAQDAASLPDTVKTTVSRTRGFLRAAGYPEAIRNVWGEGYVFDPNAAAPIRSLLGLEGRSL